MKPLKDIKFIDLFAGIGGFHQGLSYYGARCVFASEWHKNCQQIYQQNYGILPVGDITKIPVSEIPRHDILCAGFPCQAFSISGKKLGFNDTRGTLFFDVVRIASYHQPSILILENVKNFAYQQFGNSVVVNVIINDYFFSSFLFRYFLRKLLSLLPSDCYMIRLRRFFSNP